MMDDRSIINALKKDNQEAFSILYHRYWEKLYYVAYGKLGSQEETEDLLHDLFMEIWNNRKKLVIKKSLAAYLFTALKYKIFRLYDSKAVRRRYAERIQSKETPPNNNVEEYISFNELYDRIEQNIEKLPKKCRVVFKLSRFRNQTVDEISEKLKISPHTAQNHINKALKLLRYESRNMITFLSLCLLKLFC